MNRLIHVGLALLALLLAGGCGRSDPVTDGAAAPGVQRMTSTGEALYITTVAAEVQMPSSSIPDPILPAGVLPPLPTNGNSVKLSSEASELWKNGTEWFDISPNAFDNQNSLLLDPVDNNFAWGMYEFPLESRLADLQSFTFEVSNKTFGGATPGFWIGIADYSKNSWTFVNVTNTTEDPQSRKITISNSQPYLSPGGNVYLVAVLPGSPGEEGSQGLQIDRVGVSYNPPDWQEVIVDNRGNAGWMPSIVFDRLDNPLVAYCEDTGDSSWVVLAEGDATKDLSDPDKWKRTYVEQTPEGDGEEINDIGARAIWPDIMLHPVTGLPVISLIYDGITNQEDVSRAGMTVIKQVADTTQPFNYRFGYIDQAEWTSIDVKPGSTEFGMVTHAKNSNWGDRQPFDMTYITFNPGSPEPLYQQTSNFGENWKFPHLKYVPVSGEGAVHMNGGYGLVQVGPEQWNYFNEPEPGQTNEFGSLAVNPGNLFGASFTKNEAAPDRQLLTFVQYDGSWVGSEEHVDSLNIVNGVEELGGTNQLAYKPDGTPAIVYTEFNGNFAKVKYAEKTATGWEVRQLSTEDSLLNEEGESVVVDLAFDSEGNPAVCYNLVDGQNNCLLIVAFKGA
jgi:hypothetical protein